MYVCIYMYVCVYIYIYAVPPSFTRRCPSARRPVPNIYIHTYVCVYRITYNVDRYIDTYHIVYVRQLRDGYATLFLSAVPGA